MGGNAVWNSKHIGRGKGSALNFQRGKIMKALLEIADLITFPVCNELTLNKQEFQRVWKKIKNSEGEIMQAKLYSRLTCAQKHQKCKFVPRLFSMIVGNVGTVSVAL